MMKKNENYNYLDQGTFEVPKTFGKSDNRISILYGIFSALSNITSYWIFQNKPSLLNKSEISSNLSSRSEYAKVFIDNEFIDLSEQVSLFIKEIHKSFVNNKLVLFLGAGVSSGNGLPSWKELLSGISRDCLGLDEKHEDHIIKYLVANTDNLIYARMIKEMMIASNLDFAEETRK